MGQLENHYNIMQRQKGIGMAEKTLIEVKMEYAADDINIGYMSIILLINSENTLIDKLDKVEEIQPQYEHHIYDQYGGGVKFVVF